MAASSRLLLERMQDIGRCAPLGLRVPRTKISVDRSDARNPKPCLDAGSRFRKAKEALRRFSCGVRSDAEAGGCRQASGLHFGKAQDTSALGSGASKEWHSLVASPSRVVARMRADLKCRV